MKKTLIALRGRANSGKTTTIRMVWDKLKLQYSNQWICEKKYKHDITAILTIESKRSKTKEKIGVESQGDPASRLPDSLQLFVQLNCQIIVCATRLQGGTVKAVDDLRRKHGYTIIFCDQQKASARRYKKTNSKMAKQIFSQVKRVLTA
jgi:hypothetical protein